MLRGKRFYCNSSSKSSQLKSLQKKALICHFVYQMYLFFAGQPICIKFILQTTVLSQSCQTVRCTCWGVWSLSAEVNTSLHTRLKKPKSHRHFLQTGNYSFPKHHFWMHHGWNNVREPLYGYRCSFDCLETFSTASAMCTYMSLMFFGFGFWLQRQKRYQTLLFYWYSFFFLFHFFQSIGFDSKGKTTFPLWEKMKRWEGVKGE